MVQICEQPICVSKGDTYSTKLTLFILNTVPPVLIASPVAAAVARSSRIYCFRVTTSPENSLLSYL